MRIVSAAETACGGEKDILLIGNWGEGNGLPSWFLGQLFAPYCQQFGLSLAIRTDDQTVGPATRTKLAEDCQSAFTQLKTLANDQGFLRFFYGTNFGCFNPTRATRIPPLRQWLTDYTPASYQMLLDLTTPGVVKGAAGAILPT